jgi:hypothetical protein
MQPHRLTQQSILGSALLLLAGSVLLNGCALNGGVGSSSSSSVIATGATTHGGGIGGVVHGGQQGVSGSTVILWAAGTTGTYGTGATKIASTTTDSNGSFTLDKTATASITAYSVAYNATTMVSTATFTTTADPQTLVVGESITLGGFPTSTFFNGQTVTVLTASSTQFTANVTAIPVADNGVIPLTSESGTGAYAYSPCTPGQYLYLTATGGNGGAGNNNSIGMMAAIPTTCTAATEGTSVFIDEVTTVAAVTALQQFMSINTTATAPYTGTGTVPWTIGAPSTNVTGMANAFSITPLLASITTGQSAASFPSNTITPNNSTTPQLFTTTVATEYSKINGMADVLAVCINDSTGNLCTGSQGVLTLTTIANGATSPTYSVPVDTIQAAYNMATLPNPALYSGAKYWKNSSSSATYLSTLWNNISSQAPFQPYSTVPTDTSVSMSWKTAGATSSTAGTVYAASVAVDGNGYIWIGGGSGVTSNFVTQFMPNGQILQDVVTANLPSYTLSFYADTTTAVTGTVTANPSVTLSYGRPVWAIGIDTNNNAYFNAYSATSPGTIATEATGVMVQVTQPTISSGTVTGGTATAYAVGSVNGPLVIDNSNNIFYDAQHGTGRYYMSMLSQASAYQSDYEGIGRGSANYNGLAVDSTGYAWGFPTPTSTCGTPDTLQRINVSGMVTTTGTSATDVTIPSNCIYQGAGDANGNMWGTDGTNLFYINIGSSLTSPTVTQSFTGGAGTGLNLVGQLAVDGNGNVWAINKSTSASTVGTAGVAEFATSGTTGTVTLLSPAGAAAMGFGSTFGGYQGSPVGVALDPSGNVWFASSAGSYLYSVVGIAAPTRTPLSASYAHIGTKP